MASAETDADERLGRIVVPVAIVGAIFTLLSPFVVGASNSVGVALGALLAVANLWAIGSVVRGFLRGGGLPWGALAMLKFGTLVFVIWVILKNGWASVVPLAFGYGALPLGIVVGQLGRGTPSRRQV